MEPEERRLADEKWRREVDRRLESGEDRMTKLESAIADNTAITQEIKEDTKELVTTFRDLKGFRAVTGSAIKMVIALGMLMAAVGIFVWWLKTGELPKAPL